MAAFSKADGGDNDSDAEAEQLVILSWHALFSPTLYSFPGVLGIFFLLLVFDEIHWKGWAGTFLQVFWRLSKESIY